MLRITNLVVLACTLLACKHHDAAGVSPGSASVGSASTGSATGSAAPAISDVAPEARARAFLDKQIESAQAGTMVATFAPDAIVLARHNTGEASQIMPFGIGDSGPDGAPGGKATIAKLVADGTPDVVWFYAEVSTGGPWTARVVEMLAASAQWKAVAASFAKATELQPSGGNREMPGATANDGPLAKLLGSTSAIGAQLAPNAIILGPKADQVGKDAAALAAWKLDPLKQFQHAREVDQATWGFAQAAYDHPEAEDPTMIDRLVAQTFAVHKPDGSWSIVLVQYTSN